MVKVLSSMVMLVTTQPDASMTRSTQVPLLLMLVVFLLLMDLLLHLLEIL
jgi:hypothetical protein